MDYASLASNVRSLLQQYGQSAIFRVKSSTENTATGEVIDTFTDYTVYCVEDYYRADEANGDSIKSTDIKLYTSVSLGQPEPKPNDLMITDRQYRVVRGKRISPAGTPVLYEIQVRI